MTSFAPEPPPPDRRDHTGYHGHAGHPGYDGGETRYPGSEDARGGDNATSGHGHGSGHRWMMIACCIPMLVIAVVLVATGVASAGFLLVAVACTAMMALMMGGMGPGGRS